MGRPPAAVPAWLDLDRLADTQPMRGWQLFAGCRDTPLDAFYQAGGGPPAEVHRLCKACPVRYACLTDLLAQEGAADPQLRHSHRAATTSRERRAIWDALRARREDAA